MSAYKDQFPPALPDKQVLDTYYFVEPAVFGIALIGMGYVGHSEEIKRFVDQGDEQGYTPLLITWKTGEYCLIAYHHIYPGVAFVDVSSDIVIEAYRRARNPDLTGPPVLTCHFKKGGAANG